LRRQQGRKLFDEAGQAAESGTNGARVEPIEEQGPTGPS